MIGRTCGAQVPETDQPTIIETLATRRAQTRWANFLAPALTSAALTGAALTGATLTGAAVTGAALIAMTGQAVAQTGQTLPPKVAEILKRVQIGRKDIALHAQAIDASEPLLSINAQEPFVLASTAKLITTLSALELLGPTFRWQTSAHLGTPLRKGRIDGDLTLVGGGDPLLNDQQLLSWFGKMQKRGLREIGGDIVIDRQAFRLTAKDFANTPKPSWDNPHHANPDAFLLNEGQFDVLLRNGARGLEVSLRPELPAIKLDVQIQVSSLACADRKKPISADWRADDSSIVLSGEWSKDCNPHSVAIAPWSNAELSAQTVAMLWRKAGGVLEGSVVEHVNNVPSNNVPPKEVTPARIMRTSVRPVSRKAWMVFESAPLLEVIRPINKWSNNVVSRQLFLSLSAEFPKRVASSESAQQSLVNWLATRGLNTTEMKLENGSGLSREERGQALVLARLLIEAWSSPIGRSLLDSMSIVGVDGTMAGRLKSSPVAGHAFIKTGSLNAVRAVAGFVRSKSGKNYAVVANINHEDAHLALPAIDAFIEWVYING
jgi:serine-type D-Ala-D-Ala carboxypeptidase/endopeptidase (penicillin-binding protein 4)